MGSGSGAAQRCVGGQPGCRSVISGPTAGGGDRCVHGVALPDSSECGEVVTVRPTREGARAVIESGERAAVLDRHARKGRNGKPQTCQPSAEELHSHEFVAQRAPKVIFESRATASAAAAELAALGAQAMEPYRCARSKSGHWHLATTR